MSTIAEIARKESERLIAQMMIAVDQGYVIWDFWNDPIGPGDSVITFGMISMVKRASTMAHAAHGRP